ncbi:MAG: glycosyltransferase family 2 protein [Acidobacteriota bacterium]|nr:glycosyltransferase family 2 protein [Acidobacteriota bacterium]
MNVTFSIVVPLFNEAENIKHLVQTLVETLGTNPNFTEIVLVDDGSYDATAALATDLAARDKRIRLVCHERNQGLGAAIRTGLNHAEGDFVLYTDADLPFDFNLIPQLFSLADENRIVSGYRLNRGEGGRRLLLTKAYNALVRLFFGLRMRDVNFACKIFPKRFLRKARLNSQGSFIDVEILLEARRFGFEIVEHPLVYYPRTRGLSTLSRPAVIAFILKEMFGYAGKIFSDRIALLGIALSRIARQSRAPVRKPLGLSESE